MRLDRRSFLVGAAASTFLSRSGFGDEPPDNYADFDVTDIFEGTKGPLADVNPNDLVKVGINVARATAHKDHVSIMEALSTIDSDPQLGENAIGSTGEYFNRRWRRTANPLIVRFFHDIGYKKTPMPGDCTPWCAATVSWALKQSGLSIPADPASSQSFKNYGTKIANFEEAQRGDICVFTDIADSSHGHVGLWRGFESGGKVVKVLAGNQDGKGATECRAGFPKSKIDELAFNINNTKDSSISSNYLHFIVRPMSA